MSNPHIPDHWRMVPLKDVAKVVKNTLQSTNSAIVDNNYLSYWRFHGALTYVPDAKPAEQGRLLLARALVPLPPLSEQVQIAHILRIAASLRALRKAMLHDARNLLPAIFEATFSGSAWNQHTAPLRKIIGVEAGRSIAGRSHRARPGQPGVLKTSAITHGTFRPEENKEVPPESFLSRYEVQEGDLLINRANDHLHIGATVFVRNTPPSLMLSDKIWRVIIKDEQAVNRIYLLGLLNSSWVREEVRRNARGSFTSMQSIRQDEFLKIHIPLPDLVEQNAFASKIKQLWKVIDDQEQAYIDTENLFDSLLEYAFRGNLTSAWRTQQRDTLKQAADDRDAALDLHLSQARGRKRDVTPRTEQVQRDLWSEVETAPVLPQPDRLEYLHLGSAAQLLENAGNRVYFRAIDLAKDSHEVLAVEEDLRLLAALGFVKSVRINGRVYYRYVNIELDQASFGGKQ